MYTAPGQGQTAPRDKVSMSTGTSCHFIHLLQVSKKMSLKSDFIHFVMILCIYIAPGQEQTAPRGQSFDVNRMFRHFIHLLQASKNVFEV